MGISTYSFAAVRIEEENRAPFALEQIPRLGHDLRHQTLQVVLEKERNTIKTRIRSSENCINMKYSREIYT